MLDRKNIDRVFQENLKDLEIEPSKKVWNNIEHALTENRYKKTITLWRRLSGVAMMFVLALTAGMFYYNSNSSVEPLNEVTNSKTINSNKNKVTPINKPTEKPKIELAQTANKKRPTSIKKEERIFVKKPNNNVIVTSENISSVYKNIENKYIIDKDDFIDELKSDINVITQSETKKIIEEPKTKNWSVGPTVAPVYYNTLQSGSPLNDNLADNSKTTDDALSVGVKVNYQLSNKLFIQSGINKVELAYNTKDVNANLSSAKFAYNNINTDKPGVILSPIPKNQSADLPSVNNLNKSTLNGDINQSIEYFEFPLEMKYSLLDQKFGVNLIGGVSTYFLTKNNVSIISQNEITSLGEANNLNNINFSGNLGVDLDYKINNSWYLNVAPMFKYQFNTYSNNSGDFRPYYFGVYSGLNFKF